MMTRKADGRRKRPIKVRDEVAADRPLNGSTSRRQGLLLITIADIALTDFTIFIKVRN